MKYGEMKYGETISRIEKVLSENKIGLMGIDGVNIIDIQNDRTAGVSVKGKHIIIELKIAVPL